MMKGESGRLFNLGGFVCQQEEHPDSSGFSHYLFKRGRHSKCFKRPQLPMGVVFGLIIICLGVGMVLDNLCLIYMPDVLLFSPCALIVMGFVMFWNRGLFNIWGQILVFGGLLMQITVFRRDLLTVQLWWSALIIWVGILVVIKAFIPKKPKNTPQKVQVVPFDERQWNQDIDDIDAPSVVVVEQENEEEHP